MQLFFVFVSKSLAFCPRFLMNYVYSISQLGGQSQEKKCFHLCDFFIKIKPMNEITNMNRRFTDRRKVKIFLLTLLLLATVFLGVTTYAASQLKRPLMKDAPTRMVTVARGSTTSDIAKDLESKNIIGNYRFFVYYVMLKGGSQNIQAGNYELSASMTIPEIVEHLTEGKVYSNEVRIRINEGWNLDQIANEIEKSGIGKREDFFKLVGTTPSNGGDPANSDLVRRFSFLSSLPRTATLEGYLFPDTYQVSRAGGVEELVDKMLRNFDKKVNQDLQAEFSAAASQRPARTARQIIIMASLIEGEVGRNITGNLSETDIKELEEERHIVSDVFWSRLARGMGMESDATVGYATGKARRQATFADLEINSPYNTYRFAGLPPGSINNPGLDSIRAALSPANTDFLFFLSAPDGKAYFAKTLQEHNANRAKYLPID